MSVRLGQAIPLAVKSGRASTTRPSGNTPWHMGSAETVVAMDKRAGSSAQQNCEKRMVPSAGSLAELDPVYLALSPRIQLTAA
jgi:hypothetical protein